MRWMSYGSGMKRVGRSENDGLAREKWRASTAPNERRSTDLPDLGQQGWLL